METKFYKMTWNNGTFYYAHSLVINGEMIFSARIKDDYRLMITHARIGNGIDLALMEEDYTEILKYYLKIAKDLNVRYVEMSKGTGNLFKKNRENELINYGFTSVSQEERNCALFLDEKVRQNGWLLDRTGEFLKVKNYMKVIKERIREELDAFNGSAMLVVKEKVIEININLKEKTYVSEMKKEEDVYTIEFQEEKFSFTNEDELKEVIKEMIERIKKKHRLLFLYNPPREWFDRRMREYRIKEETTERIYHELHHHMNFEEIEIRSKHEVRQMGYERFSKVKWFTFLGFIFVLNEEGEYLIHFKENEKEKVKEYTYQYIEEELKKEMMKQIEEEKLKIFSK